MNTIRMFLYQQENGDVIPLKSFLKTGKPGALIDKTENGGASVFIDQATGILQNGFNWSPEIRTLQQRPGSGIPFAGVDIAISEQGPMMVEMNVHPDPDCIPVLRLQTAKIFAT